MKVIFSMVTLKGFVGVLFFGLLVSMLAGCEVQQGSTLDRMLGGEASRSSSPEESQEQPRRLRDSVPYQPSSEPQSTYSPAPQYVQPSPYPSPEVSQGSSIVYSQNQSGPGGFSWRSFTEGRFTIQAPDGFYLGQERGEPVWMLSTGTMRLRFSKFPLVGSMQGKSSNEVLAFVRDELYGKGTTFEAERFFTVSDSSGRQYQGVELQVTVPPKPHANYWRVVKTRIFHVDGDVYIAASGIDRNYSLSLEPVRDKFLNSARLY